MILSFEDALNEKYLRLKDQLHTIIDKRPAPDLAKGILALQLMELSTFQDKIKYLQTEISTGGASLGKLTANTWKNIQPDPKE